MSDASWSWFSVNDGVSKGVDSGRMFPLEYLVVWSGVNCMML